MGSPALARHVFDELQRSEGLDSWSALVEALKPRLTGERWMNPTRGTLTGEEAADWRRIANCLEGLSQIPADLAIYQDWAPKVARFAFWPQEDSLPEPQPREKRESLKKGAPDSAVDRVSDKIYYVKS